MKKKFDSANLIAGIIVFLIFAVFLGGSMLITSGIVDSSLPLWLKIWLLR
jgi:hypothetical protein